MIEYPKVIGFIPVYQAENFIFKTLTSLARQDYPNFEIWVCDDASMDRSAQICKEFCEQDARFKFFENDQNLGWWETCTRFWNLCAKESIYCFFHPHDDLPFPNFISAQVEILEKHPNSTLCIPGIKNSFASGKSKTILFDQWTVLDSPSQQIIPLVNWEVDGWWAAIHGVHRSKFISKVNRVNYLRFGEREFALDLIWLVKLAGYGPFVCADQVLFEKFYSDQSLSGSWKYNLKNRSAVYLALSEEVLKIPIPLSEKLKIFKAILKKSFSSAKRKLFLSK